MYLFYTSVTEAEATQTKPYLSLGGYKSSSKVQNSKLNNLFGDITPATISNFYQDEYIALVLKNTLTTDVTNVKLWFEYPDDMYSVFYVAAVDMAEDSTEELYMEHVDSKNSQPLMGDFYKANGEDNAVDLGDISSGSQIGIWLKRELLLDYIKEDQELVYESDSTDSTGYKVVERVLGKQDEIAIAISYD
jgi:hypothetical protein